MRWFRKTGLFNLSRKYQRDDSSHRVIIANANSSTYDFYFASRQCSEPHFSIINIEEDGYFEKLREVLVNSCSFILVRDVPLSILEYLARHGEMVNGVTWFFDDDIPGAAEDIALPKAYRKKLAIWYRKAWPFLEALCDEIQVSTAWLAAKYQLGAENILSPLEPIVHFEVQPVRCFYHGSGSHTKDWSFILDVARKVQTRNDNIWFEFIGDHALYKSCRDIPRVQVFHPMKWSDYLAFTASRTAEIGLAPLMNNEFNLARSHTKFLDICRQGAVGIYSRRFSHADDIESHHAGLILDDSVDAWVQGIEYLAKKSRKQMLDNAMQLRSRLAH